MTTANRCKIAAGIAVLTFLYSITTSNNLISHTTSYNQNNHAARTHVVDAQPTTAAAAEAEKRTSCLRIATALNVTTWPKVIYHKELPDVSQEEKTYFDYSKFSSVQEDDSHAHATIDQFNELRSSVLTPDLLREGFLSGGMYPARTFAKRLLNSRGENQTHPLTIAVFGNSFTIGSNCGESSSQNSDDCAWPSRLVRRWEEIIRPIFRHTAVQWRMFQENAQGSVNIAQKFPSILEEFRSKNVTPDVILLDNTITDVNYKSKPWFEAVVRKLVESYPETVIVSLVDAIPNFVHYEDGKSDAFLGRLHRNDAGFFLGRLHQVQKHYGLFGMNIAKMAHKLSTRNDTHRVDLLWPQSLIMVSPNGTELDNGDVEPSYWANFLPKVRKTKYAYYPENHPPWPTHQYVADSVAYALLRVVQMGSGCSGNDIESSVTPYYLPETTVAPKADIDACFICHSPSARIDARSTRYRNIIGKDYSSITSNNTADTTIPKEDDESVTVTCGDWAWITDERNRSGWQSDQFGSLIKFRIKVSAKPTISLTYMKSHETFGDLGVSFRPVTKDKKEDPLGCGDFQNLPSIRLDGSIPKFSQWETTVFPYENEYYDAVTVHAWNLFNETVLSQTGVEYVDLYVENINEFGFRRRIKIQAVTSC